MAGHGCNRDLYHIYFYSHPEQTAVYQTLTNDSKYNSQHHGNRRLAAQSQLGWEYSNTQNTSHSTMATDDWLLNYRQRAQTKVSGLKSKNKQKKKTQSSFYPTKSPSQIHSHSRPGSRDSRSRNLAGGTPTLSSRLATVWFSSSFALQGVN